jgi:hypothetical protein
MPRKRTCKILLTLDPMELEVLRKFSSIYGLSQSESLRQLIQSAGAQVGILTPRDISELRQITRHWVPGKI